MRDPTRFKPYRYYKTASWLKVKHRPTQWGPSLLCDVIVGNSHKLGDAFKYV